MKNFNTVDEIRDYFIKDGWSDDIVFSEFTYAEALKKGCLSIASDILNGEKYFKMENTGNIFDSQGEVAFYDIPTANKGVNMFYLESKWHDVVVSKIVEEIVEYEGHGRCQTGELVKANIPSLEQLIEICEDDNIEAPNQEDYEYMISIIEEMPDKFDVYVPDYDPNVYIELNGNRTLWDIENEKMDMDIYNAKVEATCEEFRNLTGVDISLQGRMGRHVCVDLNITNLMNYEKLCIIQQGLEQSLIKECNEYGKDEIVIENNDEER